MRSNDKRTLELKGERGNWSELKGFELTPMVERLATKVGVVLISDLALYLPEELMMAYKPNFLMPLIVADELIGLIVSNDWDSQDAEDLIFADALKKLVNNAFYTGIQMENNHEFKKQMDRKLYDQMLLHQLIEVAISELEVDQVIKNCVDGLRELTASSQTSFCLLEDHSGKIAVKHYSDLKTFRKVYGEVVWRPHVSPKRMTYSVADHREELIELFGNMDLFERLESKYVILLKMNPVIGFVTLGEPLGTQVYTKSTFDLIESIMSTINVAIENANHIATLNNQKMLLNSTVEAMTQLGNSIKTVNSATDLTELSELIFQSINLYTGTDEAILAIRLEPGVYRVTHSTENQYLYSSFTLTELACMQVEKGLVLNLRKGSLEEYVCGLDGDLSEKTTMIAPIDVVRINDEETTPEALLIGLNMNRKFLNYEHKYVETLASSVAPILRHLIHNQAMQEAQKKTDAHRFLAALEEHENDKQDYWMMYKVCYKKDETGIFDEKPKLLDDRPTYQLGRLSCCFVYEEELVPDELFEGSLEGSPKEIIEALELLCG
jgi:hypothetical protein